MKSQATLSVTFFIGITIKIDFNKNKPGRLHVTAKYWNVFFAEIKETLPNTNH
jgi:hypothetical protein